MRKLFMTHDLSCTIGDLGVAARRVPGDPRHDGAFSAMVNLSRTAIAFTIQLAIDHAGRDPEEMRSLERELHAALEAT
jgi:hypothetical protein